MPKRAPKFQHEYSAQAFRICRIFGASEAELSEYFEITEKQLARWMTSHPEFGRQVKLGKLLADGDVAERLHRAALTNTNAVIHWLRNRQPAHWGKVAESPHIATDLHFPHRTRQ